MPDQSADRLVAEEIGIVLDFQPDLVARHRRCNRVRSYLAARVEGSKREAVSPSRSINCIWTGRSFQINMVWKSGARERSRLGPSSPTT